MTDVLEPGMVVGIVTSADVPCRALVGQVQALDERGVRISHVDWLVGDFVGMDVFVPWRRIEFMEVATDAHQPADGHWADWQKRMLIHQEPDRYDA